jgi:predicted kinase
MSGNLIMTKGLPASGKSTWAADQAAGVLVQGRPLHPERIGKWVIVTKDDIRDELGPKTWNFDVEKEVLRIRDFRISAALSKGLTVISADTNLAPKHEIRLRELAKQYKANFEIKDFTDIPLDICIQRDALRDGIDNVGEKVIRDMAEQFLDPSSLIFRTEYNGKQLFVDLDGVLADFDGFIAKEFGIEGNRENERPDFWDIVRGYDKRCSVCKFSEDDTIHRKGHEFVAGRLYYDMKPLPYATDLWNGLKRFNPIILTGCPWSIPTAADDKRQWVAEFIDPEAQVITCRSRSKRFYGKPGDILLDDWTKYQPLWESMGGTFILHDPNTWEKSVRTIEEELHTKES